MRVICTHLMPSIDHLQSMEKTRFIAKNIPFLNLKITARIIPTDYGGASFDPAAQRLQWTPGADDSGNYTVPFTVTDDGGPPMSDSENVAIAVSQSQEQKSGNISGGSGSGGGGCFIAGLLRKGGDFAQLFEHLSPSAPAEKAPTQSGTP